MAEVPPVPELDPDIAWAFREDADPAAVARLQKELARPLADMVREAERKAIAMFSPLEGDPAKAGVKDCTISDRRLFAPPEEVVSLIGGGSTYIPLRGQSRTNESGHVNVTHWAGGAGGSGSFGGGGGTSPPPEPEALCRLRERRLQAHQQLWLLADAASREGRPFTDAEVDAYGWLSEEMRFMDERIKGFLAVIRLD